MTTIEIARRLSRWVGTAVLLSAAACSPASEGDDPALRTPIVPPSVGAAPSATAPGATAAGSAAPAWPAAAPNPPGAAPTPGSQSPGAGVAAPGGAAATPGAMAGSVQSAGAAPYSQLPDGRGGFNIEQVSYAAVTGFDKAASLAAFQSTLYPILRENCSACHSTDTRAQAPIHADVDPALAHEYALTRLNPYTPEDSKFVVRQLIDRHHCFGSSCKDSGAKILSAVQAWATAIKGSMPEAGATMPKATAVPEQQVTQWIAADKANLKAGDADFVVYVSLHEMQNAGLSADRLNVARAGLSKALNSTARWAPKVVNPVDINGMGIVYRFDTRDYWGYNKGVKQLIYGGSDDDIFAGSHTDTLRFRFNFAKEISADPNFAKTIWNRVKQGSIDAYKQNGKTVNVAGFKAEYVEAGQLIYTLSRPDVYNTIMSLPTYATELETELGVIKKGDYKSYEYRIIDEAITIDSRFVLRANTTTGGFYYKTFDLFALGGEQVFPFREHPIPKFVSSAGAVPTDLSLIASLLQPTGGAPANCNASTKSGGFTLCTNYTGDNGVQQQASEIIWDMPNGLQGYAIYGGLNQRRVDAFSFIVHDPRRLLNASDAAIACRGPASARAACAAKAVIPSEIRLMTGGSCMSCHIDGMNRMGNDFRDQLDNKTLQQVSWLGDADMEAKVREVYPPTAMVRPQIEQDRKPYFDAMAQIRGGMILGQNQNLYVEPIGWGFEWAQKFYKYTDTISN